MSADPHSGRNSNNAGSDTKRHYDQGNIMDRFNRSSVGGAKPTQNDPMILNVPKVPKDNGFIKDR
jgi:hypothetical protein